MHASFQWRQIGNQLYKICFYEIIPEITSYTVCAEKDLLGGGFTGHNINLCQYTRISYGLNEKCIYQLYIIKQIDST